MSNAKLIGLLLSIFADPLSYIFIIFWIVYRTTKKRWAKIVAIIFTVIAAFAFMADFYRFFV